jgi:Domain of unknown function (DUF4411)
LNLQVLLAVAYLIDCDAIAHLAGAAHCGVVLEGLKRLVASDILKTVEQVYDELRRWPDLQGEFKPIKKQFLVDQYTPEIAAVAGQIADDFPFLFDLTGTRNPDPADPWLIAAGRITGWTVITDERKTSTRRIPYVCRQQSINVRCINGPEFFAEVGIHP